MVEIGDVEEDKDADVEVVVVVEEEVVHARHLQTICKTRKWQEDVGEWHL